MRPGTTRHRVFVLFALFAALAIPATAVAHGLVHRDLAAEHDHATGTAAHEGSAAFARQSADDADHPGLHCRERATRSPSTIHLVSVAAVTLIATLDESAGVATCVQGAGPPPSRLARPDQPRAPPRG
jgi:hypothetical protein